MATVRCIDDARGVSVVRVLVVEDFEPFRRFICSKLGENPELLVIGEASDGLEAVCKAEELQPDLVLLDIGLPKLNGIEAGQQLRKLSPKSKIIFVTQESSAEVVHEALSLGARGYVVKTSAESDLLAAVESVISGKFCQQHIGEFRHHPARSIRGRTAATLSRRVEAAFVGLPVASSANSVVGVEKREMPQLKQIETFGNNQTPGLSMFLRPLKSTPDTRRIRASRLP